MSNLEKKTLIVWTSELSVNIPKIDEQHKQLISYLNELYSHMKVGKGKEIIGQTLKKLVDYTKFHFHTEEDYFEEFNYSDKDSHEKEHEDFIDKVSGVVNDFENGKLATSITIEVFQFLNQWVSNHIKKTDKKYEPFLKDKNV